MKRLSPLFLARPSALNSLFLETLFLSGSGCVAQLVERSLPIPEVRGSNPIIGKNLLNICLLSAVLKR